MCAQGKVNPAFGGGHSAQGSFFSITFNRSFLQGVRTAKWQRTALVVGKIPPNNLSLSAAILIDKADKLDARHVAGAVPLPPPAKRDPVVELRSHPGLSANLLPQSGCPTWIRTMTRRVKVACATITPSGKGAAKEAPLPTRVKSGNLPPTRWPKLYDRKPLVLPIT